MKVHILRQLYLDLNCWIDTPALKKKSLVHCPFTHLCFVTAHSYLQQDIAHCSMNKSPVDIAFPQTRNTESPLAGACGPSPLFNIGSAT